MITEQDAIEYFRSIYAARYADDIAAAEFHISTLMAGGSSEVKAQACWHAAQIKEQLGDFRGAQERYIEGLNYRPGGTFGRHDLQQLIGRTCEKLGEHDEAIQWYRRSMKTCLASEDFGCLALLPYLKCGGGDIYSEDVPMVKTLVERSWRLLAVPGQPDLNDLARAIRAIEQFIADEEGKLTK
ncbi:MAG: tetratricopeptide repeat protein [Pyrinomonadaceae bacterium]